MAGMGPAIRGGRRPCVRVCVYVSLCIVCPFVHLFVLLRFCLVKLAVKVHLLPLAQAVGVLVEKVFAQQQQQQQQQQQRQQQQCEESPHSPLGRRAASMYTYQRRNVWSWPAFVFFRCRRLKYLFYTALVATHKRSAVWSPCLGIMALTW